MSWYGVHVIIYLKYLEELQKSYDVQENILLIEATTAKEALVVAEILGKKYEVDITTGPENKPARWVYGGIRDLIECQGLDTETLKQPPDFKPSHGTEVSYVFSTVKNLKALNKLIRGEAVDVTLTDTTPPSDEELVALLNIYADNRDES